MFRNMVTSLLKHDRIRTTEAKAKELRRWADQIVTLAKKGDLHARRRAMSIVREKDVVHKLFEEAAERFGTINGGYTRIIKIGRRAGDAAPLTLVELVSADEGKPAKTTSSKPAGKAATLPLDEPETPPAQAVEGADPASEDTATEGADGIETAPVGSSSEVEGADVPEDALKRASDVPDTEK